MARDGSGLVKLTCTLIVRPKTLERSLMNMKFAAVAVLGTLSLAALAPQASAADNGFYLGAGITQTEFDIDDVGSDSLDDNSFKLIAGFRPLDWLAIEAN